MITKLTAEQRQRLYGSAAAVLVLLGIYKIVAPEDAPLWLNLVANILGLGYPAVASTTATVVVKQQREDGTLS
ncbi:hypothetical protein [Mycobacterium sp. PSTR-4-N]|uniref:hypothetical protein n=1 Tax=Mycobacterium sp. PSTR-4-N TaxID=2917745 RepID=UPI001F155F7C|nr:hypothetical protein [Mycobacterium sp. PSTR-4-N]MCG7595937.1 hypothetical protein [Mycobacterium sp. PSTR-4-N]